MEIFARNSENYVSVLLKQILVIFCFKCYEKLLPTLSSFGFKKTVERLFNLYLLYYICVPFQAI